MSVVYSNCEPSLSEKTEMLSRWGAEIMQHFEALKDVSSDRHVAQKELERAVSHFCQMWKKLFLQLDRYWWGEGGRINFRHILSFVPERRRTQEFDRQVVLPLLLLYSSGETISVNNFTSHHRFAVFHRRILKILYTILDRHFLPPSMIDSIRCLVLQFSLHFPQIDLTRSTPTAFLRVEGDPLNVEDNPPPPLQQLQQSQRKSSNLLRRDGSLGGTTIVALIGQLSVAYAADTFRIPRDVFDTKESMNRVSEILKQSSEGKVLARQKFERVPLIPVGLEPLWEKVQNTGEGVAPPSSAPAPKGLSQALWRDPFSRIADCRAILEFVYRKILLPTVERFPCALPFYSLIPLHAAVHRILQERFVASLTNGDDHTIPALQQRLPQLLQALEGQQKTLYAKIVDAGKQKVDQVVTQFSSSAAGRGVQGGELLLLLLLSEVVYPLVLVAHATLWHEVPNFFPQALEIVARYAFEKIYAHLCPPNNDDARMFEEVREKFRYFLLDSGILGVQPSTLLRACAERALE